MRKKGTAVVREKTVRTQARNTVDIVWFDTPHSHMLQAFDTGGKTVAFKGAGKGAAFTEEDFERFVEYVKEKR